MISRRALIAAFTATPAIGAASRAAASAASAHAFGFEGIDGGDITLGDFAGRPVLVVNTASRCGFTYQYDQLQALYDRFRERGLVVLGVPSDDFNQELGTEADVKHFCEVNFGIDFPMTAITAVRGRDAHPFYAWARQTTGRGPRWNFHKYLVAPDGGIAGHWGSNTEPMSRPIVDAVEAQLPTG
ncbi:MAG: glutathione peroxidase [Pseudomonadota bacterium]